jgi:hypothetical protein
MPAQRGEQPWAENGPIPGLQRADPRTERPSAQAKLADGKDSNYRYPIGPKLQGCGSADEQAAIAN